MQIFITGISRIIGISLCNHLVAQGLGVVGFDLVKSQDLPNDIAFIKGDVRDTGVLASAAAGCDLGIHLAVLATNAKEVDIMSTNVFGMYSYLQAAKQAQLQNSIVVSSAPVHLNPENPDSEIFLNTADDDDHLYDLTKALQEIIGRDSHTHGLPVLCLRLGHVVFGKDEVNLGRTQTLDQLQYCRGGWVALEDVVNACSAALLTEPSMTDFEIINVVGSAGARKRFQIADTESRLGIELKYDFKLYD